VTANTTRAKVWRSSFHLRTVVEKYGRVKNSVQGRTAEDDGAARIYSAVAQEDSLRLDVFGAGFFAGVAL
jgi:hypothetical protein